MNSPPLNFSAPSSAPSSPLPELFSRTPTPPPPKIMAGQQQPTPPPSQSSDQSSELSTAGTCTPRSELDLRLSTRSRELDGTPPLKKRRLNGSMPRQTRHLNLEDMGSKGSAALPEEQEQLDRLVKCLRKKRKIVVVAGAGISVSAGIPDFRSTEGLFKTLKDTHNLKGSGKQLFDASVYRDAGSTTHFHEMVREMSTMSRAAKPTPFHHLIARLAHEGRLLRLYSQNVDGLETSLPPLITDTPLGSKAPWPKTVQLHGGLEKMVCTKCHKTSDFQADLFDGPVPPLCGACEEADLVRTEHAGKRSHGVGRMRPRMVLYNEHNPDDEAIGSVTKADLQKRPDAVIVVGTSCKVPGVRRIVREMCGVVRDRRDGLTVWLNHDPIPTGKDMESCWDLIVRGTADEVADHANLGRWDDPEIVVEAVDEANVQAVKHSGTTHKVLVESPRKIVKHFDPIQDAVATAKRQVACKKEEAEIENWPASTLDVAAIDPAPSTPRGRGRPAKPKATLKNPASQGLSIDRYLDKQSGIKREEAPAEPNPKPASKSPTKRSVANTGKATLTKTTNATKSASTKVPRKSRTKTTAAPAAPATSNLKIHLKITKPNATRARSAINKPPAKKTATTNAPRRDSALEVLPDSHPSVNSASSSPTAEKMAGRGGLARSL